MARKKQYDEVEVIDKAMRLFWRNGYENTSVRMLEKAMGINQFSIYASFKNKQGVFLESVKHYKTQIKTITDKLEHSNNGVAGIEAYFHDFLEFSKEASVVFKGCLVTNTVNEIKEDADPVIMQELKKFLHIKSLFVRNLKQDDSIEEEEINKLADYLMNCILGLSISSKVFDKTQLASMIEITFKRL